MGERAIETGAPRTSGTIATAEAPSLLVVGESGAFSRPLPAQGEITVGRSDGCDIVVDDPKMSRRHVLVRTTAAGTIEAIDLGSTNGTSLDGRRLQPNLAVTVDMGATLTAASTVIVVRTRAQASRACGLVKATPAELQALLATECDRGAATLGHRNAFALVKVQAERASDNRAIEEVLGDSLRRRDVVAAIAPGTYVALLLETSSARADAVASRVTSVFARRGLNAKLQVAMFPRDGDTPDRLARSRGTEPSPPVDLEGERGGLPGWAPRALEAQIEAISAATTNVLIVGEEGAGKEVVARILHARSARRGPFLRVECAAALADPGLFDSAAGGTVFLHEIGEMHPALQRKLLDVIAQRSALGAGERRATGVRFVATTRHEPGEDAGRHLPADLLRWLDEIRVTVPPLRARADEIELLAKALVRAACVAVGRREEVRISAPAMALLKHHSWPRNLRELKEVLERAVVLANDVITLEHLPCADLAPTVSVRRP